MREISWDFWNFRGRFGHCPHRRQETKRQREFTFSDWQPPQGCFYLLGWPCEQVWKLIAWRGSWLCGLTKTPWQKIFSQIVDEINYCGTVGEKLSVWKSGSQSQVATMSMWVICCLTWTVDLERSDEVWLSFFVNRVNLTAWVAQWSIGQPMWSACGLWRSGATKVNRLLFTKHRKEEGSQKRCVDISRLVEIHCIVVECSQVFFY